MDLNYPSERIKNLSGQLNNIDRRFGSVIISNPRIQLPSKIIPGKLKKKCLDLISKDKADVLITVMN